MSVLNELKTNYNHNLLRYYNGCNYCREHKKQADKWLPELLEILENINILLEEIMKYEQVSEKEKLEGFEL